MKYVFNTLSIGENHTRDYTCKLVNDILTKTNHDFLITTDVPNIITDKFDSSRVKIHEIKKSDYKIRLFTNECKLGSDFNFNLKYLCFEKLIGTDYDYIINTDCDNSVEWFNDDEVDEFLNNEYKDRGYDFFAPRADWLFGGYLQEYYSQDNKQLGLMWHKILNYNITLDDYERVKDIPMPAEHVLVIKNNEKLEKFFNNWKEYHDKLANLEFTHGTWAEGFEIGASAYFAGYKMGNLGWHHSIVSRIVKYNTYKTGHQSEFD